MCGILGILNIDSNEIIEESLLIKMVSSMAHRGPDGSGTWVQKNGQCGLAHRRLSIIDLSDAGHQPMSTNDGRINLTFNGEIYNYKELRKEMECLGYKFKSNSDTEVILYVYKKYGDKFVHHLDGDFAIALWDLDNETLILARDQAGVKPLYYAYYEGKLIFASEIKAILTYPGFEKQIDEKSFYDYLTFLVVPPPSTIIKGVFKLEAATILKIKKNEGYNPQKIKYWKPIPKVDYQRKFDSLDEELEEIFLKSVKKRLAADVPVGVLYSGGVDSTLNLGSFKSLITQEKVKTFTVGIEGGGNFHDDAKIAKEMASRIGSEHYEVKINEDDIIKAAQSLAYMQDEPISDPVALPLYFVTKLAKENGVKVLQAGEGADELFCGYDNYRRFLAHNKYLWSVVSNVPKWVSAAGVQLLSIPNDAKLNKIKDVLYRRSKGQNLFMSSAVAYYELEKQSVISDELKNKMKNYDSFEIVAPFYSEIQHECPNATFLQKITFIELQMRLPELLLMRADKMSMANSVEIRVPFLDRNMMDFAMRVPDAYKIRSGISKEPIKKLATKYADIKDIYRAKTGFGLPIHNWFNGKLGKHLIELLNENELIDKLINRDKVIEKIQRGVIYVNEGFQLWVLYNFLLWMRSLKITNIIGK